MGDGAGEKLSPVGDKPFCDFLKCFAYLFVCLFIRERGRKREREGRETLT